MIKQKIKACSPFICKNNQRSSSKIGRVRAILVQRGKKAFNPIPRGVGIYVHPTTYQKFSPDTLFQGGSKYTQHSSFVITKHMKLVSGQKDSPTAHGRPPKSGGQLIFWSIFAAEPHDLRGSKHNQNLSFVIIEHMNLVSGHKNIPTARGRPPKSSWQLIFLLRFCLTIG